MMLGLLPPSSSVTRLIGSAHRRMISPPVAVEPVNATFCIPGCATRWLPTVGPSAGRTLTTPGGNPTSTASSASQSAESGVRGSGLSTVVQPAASAGASFHAAIISG